MNTAAATLRPAGWGTKQMFDVAYFGQSAGGPTSATAPSQFLSIRPRLPEDMSRTNYPRPGLVEGRKSRKVCATATGFNKTLVVHVAEMIYTTYRT